MLVSESLHHRVWIDKRLRPMFVVTPRAHVERLSALDDAALCALFHDARATLQRECGTPRCDALRLNLGDFRNVAHLHLKVSLAAHVFYASPA